MDLDGFIEELWEMMVHNRRRGHLRSTFSNNERARKIGEMLYRYGGTDALFAVARVLMDTVKCTMYKAKQSDFYTDLRELEFLWSNISPEFQA